MMKTAFACWDSRIAPVFDTSQQIHVIEVEGGYIVRETQAALSDDLPVQKVHRLKGLGIGILVCGAISRPLHKMVVAYGISVIPFIAGDLRDVIHAWLAGGLDGDAFIMPGCCGRGGRLQGMNNFCKGGNSMNGGRGGGMGQGRGGGGQGRGRMGGPFAAGPGGNCVCPQCGHKELHKRGIPCVESKCPKCGSTMTRE
ncbi:MAG: NifB/NifX family molybdenum-iron cluster-binding protein [Pseudomonadota bacterium]